MRRIIVHIDDEKCNGCGRCISACAEGAIEMVDGKAHLVSEVHCDGLGDCLGECPQDAITLVERDAEPFSEEASREHVRNMATGPTTATPPVCPAVAASRLRRDKSPGRDEKRAAGSELTNWPVKLRLLTPTAPSLQHADVLLVADCALAALPGIHERYFKGRTVITVCPKFTDPDIVVGRLREIIIASSIKSLTVMHMEVPCCHALSRMACEALDASGKGPPIRSVIISTDGQVVTQDTAKPHWAGGHSDVE